MVNHECKSVSHGSEEKETLANTLQTKQGVVTSVSGGGRGVWQYDTDLLVGVVTLARMVKLLLTVRRLANTWGVDGQRRRKRRRRERERERRREGVREGNSFTGIKHVRQGAQGQHTWAKGVTIMSSACLQDKKMQTKSREWDYCERFGWLKLSVLMFIWEAVSLSGLFTKTYVSLNREILLKPTNGEFRVV